MTSHPPTFKRKYLSVLFECCRVYSRIYINSEGSAYIGRCPRCLKPVKATIGAGGTTSRIFRAQ